MTKPGVLFGDFMQFATRESYMADTELVIFGAGGPGKDLINIVKDINSREQGEKLDIVGFLDNDQEKWHKTIQGVEVLGPVKKAKELESDLKFVNTIGGPSYFWKVPSILKKSGIPLDRFKTIIHPDAYVDSNAEIGKGVVIYPGSNIYANAKIGNHVIINDAHVSHNTYVGDYSFIEGNANVAGQLDKSVFVGMNSAIKGGIEVGENSLIGMGAVVTDDVPEGVVVAGPSARYVRDTKETESKYEDIDPGN